MAEAGDDIPLSDSLAEQAINESLLNSNFLLARNIIERNPRILYRKIQVDAFEELINAMKNLDSKRIHDWLEGKSTLGILENLKILNKDLGFYSELAKTASNASPKVETEVRI